MDKDESSIPPKLTPPPAPSFNPSNARPKLTQSTKTAHSLLLDSTHNFAKRNKTFCVTQFGLSMNKLCADDMLVMMKDIGNLLTCLRAEFDLENLESLENLETKKNEGT